MRPKRVVAFAVVLQTMVTLLVVLLAGSPARANDIHEQGLGASSFDYIKDAGQSTEHSLGQGVTTSSAYAVEKVHHIAVYLQRVGTAENACVQLTLRSAYNGGDLSNVCVPAANVPTTAGWVDFYFSTPQAITPGGTYFFIVRYYGSCDTCMRMYWNNGNSYRDGAWPNTKYGQDGTSCCWYVADTDVTFLYAVDHSPLVTTGAASGITSSSATLSGTNTDDGGDLPMLYFQYGLTTSYGSTTTEVACPQGNACTRPASGLLPSTTYQYRACARNNTGTQCGSNRSFTTSAGQVNNPPNNPANPSPWDGQTGVATTTGLAWTGGDPDGNSVTYRVYLNAGSTASTLRCTTTSTTCPNGSLGGLAGNTQYSWRVTATDSLGATNPTSTTWRFTTGAAPNRAPNTPFNPSPSNGSNDQGALDSNVSWSGGDPDGDPVTYDVYLDQGTVANTLRCSGIATTTCPNANLGGLAQETSYAWRVVARDNRGGVTNGPTWTFTTVWKERDCLGHTEKMVRKYADQWVVVYHDSAVNAAAASWIPDFTSKVVSYAHSAYGSMVSYPISVLVHQGKHHGGTAGYYYSTCHELRNIIDVGANDWTEGHTNRDVLMHEIAHVVESTSHGKQGAPTYGGTVWGDGPWPEFFIYDVSVYLAGLNPAKYGNEPTAAFNEFTAATSLDPAGGTKSPYHWFRDFFYPVWQTKGAAGMKEFFRLEGTTWAGGATTLNNMNMGQFVHFMSAALGQDMKGLATHAFGWPATWQTDLTNARAAYPLAYPRCDSPASDVILRVYEDKSSGGSCAGYNVNEPDLQYDFMLDGDAANDTISSFTLKAGWKVTVYENANYTGGSRTYTASDSDLSFDLFSNVIFVNDRISSFKVAPI